LSYRDSYRGRSGGPPVGVIAIVVGLVLAVLVGVFGFWLPGLSYTDPAKVGIPRNGGTFDDTSIVTVDDTPFTTASDPKSGIPLIIGSASGWRWIGLHSTMHEYPATSRSWRFDGDGGADTDQKVSVPTQDGVQVGLEGQIVFDLNQDPKTLGDFDNKFGIRSFPTPDGSSASPSDGSDAGWQAFLATYLPNTVNNVMRREISSVPCNALVASCSLVQNGAGGGGVNPNANTSGTLQGIQDRVNTAFEAQVNSQLGGDFLKNIHFSVSKVDLPPELQAAITGVQQSYAGVSKANADAAAAQAQIATNKAKQDSYTACPACAQQDINRSIPPNVTVWAPGSATAVGIGGR
jgi:hypothetical protein